MKAYITKWALTEGIVEWECEEPKEPHGKFLKRSGSFQSAWGEGRQWHRTFQEAAERAEHIRDAKVESLKKQISRLEDMSFHLQPTPPPPVEPQKEDV